MKPRTLNQLLGGFQRRLAHRENNQRILRLSAEVARLAPQPSGQPVVLFNASTRLEGLSLNAAYQMLSGWALRMSGVPVHHFFCHAGLNPCVLGTNREMTRRIAPCQVCLSQSRHIYANSSQSHFSLIVNEELEKNLEDLPVHALEKLTHQNVPLGQIALPSLRWILRRHNLDDDDGTRYLFRQYILGAWNVVEDFRQLIQKINPAAVLVFNGMFYPEASARWAAREKGLRVISHEVGLKPFTGYFTPGDATAYPIHIPANFTMSESQNSRLDAYLEQRFQGNFSMAGVRFWPDIQNLDTGFWQRAVTFRQIVPIFTNVIFDTSQGHANVIFTDMFAWLDEILNIIKNHPETLFVIRAHPDESRPGKESQESVAGWVQKNCVDRLPNVVFIDSTERFSSYELIQKSKFVLVYNSTVGLEATLLGTPVLCGGKARFTQYSTVYFSPTASEYICMAEEFLAADHIHFIPEHRQEARRFLYYQLFRTSLPFDHFLEEDRFWPGYVALKPFTSQDLLPENSASMKAIVNGICHDGDFLLADNY